MNDYLMIHHHKYGTSHAIFTAADFDPRDLKEEDAINLAFLDFLEFEHKKIKKGDLNG